MITDMKQTRLEVIPTLAEGFTIGMKNLPSLIVATLLYLVTIWIPYINLGTTIAMNSIPARLAKGEIISPLFIFDSKYRKDFSSYLLLAFFIFAVTIVATLFMVIPGIVVAISMSLAVYILIDKDVSATEAMKLSNQATYGHKWTIFFISLIAYVAVYVAFIILFAIAYAVNSDGLAMFFTVIIVLSIMPFLLGIDSVIYRDLFLAAYEDPATKAPVAEASSGEDTVDDEPLPEEV